MNREALIGQAIVTTAVGYNTAFDNPEEILSHALFTLAPMFNGGAEAFFNRHVELVDSFVKQVSKKAVEDEFNPFIETNKEVIDEFVQSIQVYPLKQQGS